MDKKELKDRFKKIYGPGDDILIFTAPGRVNLIGEHTDYNGGFVLPAALELGTTLAARVRDDRKIRLGATDLTDKVEASYDELSKYKHIKWGNYQLGVVDEFLKAGCEVPGVDLLYDDTIPHGAGLSASAAIEVATALALATLSREKTSEVDLALISQHAENAYVGVNCGIMDQFASAMGKKDHAILLDCKTLNYELVPLKLKGIKIVITNTNKKRSLGSSKYNERRKECDKGLKYLAPAFPGLNFLGELNYEQFYYSSDLIKDETIKKRVSHVVSENERVLQSAAALKNGRIEEFGRLMYESHESLSDNYEVTGKELDTLVKEAKKIPGVIGSRMTGAGFGGCTVSLVKSSKVDEFVEKVGRNYKKKTNLKPIFYIVETADGVRELT